MSFKFFGPFKVLEWVGGMDYKLLLPAAAAAHAIFHISQLKQVLPTIQQAAPNLPAGDMTL